MSRFVWAPEYALEIEAIDLQHRQIIDYINQVYEARDSAEGQSRLAEVLSNLVDYTLSHFAFEEAVLEVVNYPALSEHQRTHRHFAELIAAMKRRFEDGEAIAEDLAIILRRWLLDHIMAEDQQYAPVVRARLLGAQPHSEGWLQQAFARYFQ